MSDRTNFIIEGKQYNGMDMYTALEDISFRVSKIRLMLDDLLNSTDQYVRSYGDALRKGFLPASVVCLGHDAHTRSEIMIDNVVEIESILKRFDVHPE